MFALHPRKHLENTNQCEAVDIFIAFGKGDKYHPNLRPEPVKQGGDSGVRSRKIHAPPPTRVQPPTPPYRIEAQLVFCAANSKTIAHSHALSSPDSLSLA
jgi:hypothetical protein